MLAYLLQGLSLGLSAAASPGPFQAFIIGASLRNGWRSTLPAAFAPLISDGPIIAVMVLVLTRMPEGALRVIQIVGAVYVLYLGFRTLQAYRRFQPGGVGAESGRTLWQAVAANFLSPGPYIFWSLLAGPILVRGWQESAANGLGFLSGFYLSMIGALILLIVLFGAARRLGSEVNRGLLGLSALALLGFGAYQLWRGLL